MPAGITADEALPFFSVTHENGLLTVSASPSETAPILTYEIFLVATLSTNPSIKDETPLTFNVLGCSIYFAANG
jgi:hypothetical protein